MTENTLHLLRRLIESAFRGVCWRLHNLGRAGGVKDRRIVAGAVKLWVLLGYHQVLWRCALSEVNAIRRSTKINKKISNETSRNDPAVQPDQLLCSEDARKVSNNPSLQSTSG